MEGLALRKGERWDSGRCGGTSVEEGERLLRGRGGEKEGQALRRK